MIFAYTLAATDESSFMPRLPITLSHKGHTVSVEGLLDTGSAINLLPYAVGVSLGAVWEQQTTVVPLAGNIASAEARALSVFAHHPALSASPVQLVFAWSRAPMSR
jgi:hypothetical protein